MTFAAVLLSFVVPGWAQVDDSDLPATPYVGESSRESTDDILLGRRFFEAGAHSSWHMHPGGQLLFIEEGHGRVQRRGEPIRELGPGDSDFTGPNIPHWHGAAPDDGVKQDSMSFGGIGPWLDPVTEDEYLGRVIRSATGDQQRHYFFNQAGQFMPYRLYVPESYNPDHAAPLVVALHGYGGDQDYFFNRVENLPELLEQHGFIFVAPMGYSRGGWYGAPLNIPGDAPRSGGGPTPTPERSPEEETAFRALSEQDVMNVIDIVKQEYSVDPDRTYLMGHSMGGFGTWWLGQKYADMWAAIAPLSGVLPDIDYRLPRLREVAVHVSIGGEENPAWVEASRMQVEAMNAMGMETGYFEPEGENHGSMIGPTVPRALEFLSKYTRD